MLSTAAILILDRSGSYRLTFASISKETNSLKIASMFMLLMFSYNATVTILCLDLQIIFYFSKLLYPKSDIRRTEIEIGLTPLSTTVTAPCSLLTG